ncbi:fungal-specific transcription factor domain-containing protein [Exophiala viscosa]|uniref:Fungal-specific transcription factor domain-containing protein n=1 Tax=Exophiala viscosa TaxID=2486360 RepID=A0AAN6DSW8_9EURO|nr:fungal-specific transcription factor domain-containing protein [Exophiala viscosa]
MSQNATSPRQAQPKSDSSDLSLQDPQCDNNITGCDNCRRSGSICLVEDPATKRWQPRNYLETLEQRVAFLEGILTQYRPDVAEDHFFQAEPQQQEAQTSPTPFEQRSDNQYSGRSVSPLPNDEHDGLDELESKVGLLSLNAAGAEPHYLGPSSVFAFSRLINSSLRQVVVTNHPNPSTLGDLDNDSMTTPTPCLLPDHDVALRLSNVYFDNIHSQYPYLHEPTFRLWERTLFSKSAAVDTLMSSPVPLFFLNMVYAIGALLVPNSGCSAEVGETAPRTFTTLTDFQRLYMSAQLYIDHILPYDNLESIQAILCCAAYSLRSSIGTSTWKLAGLALRQCIDLGYHRNSKRFKPSADPLRTDLRKRVFWCAYVMECQAAVMLGRPLGIPYQEVDAEYPLDIDDSCITETGIHGTPRASPSDPPTSMTRAIHAFRMRRLLGRIHTSLYSELVPSGPSKHLYRTHIDQLRSELEEWRSLTPPMAVQPSHGGATALSLFQTSDWFDMEYNYTLLQLYRVHIVSAQEGATDSIFLDCLRASERICHSYRRQFLGKPTSYTWSALHELFLAGLTYLHCLWTSPAARKASRQGQVSSTCTDCTIVLVIMAERWDTAAPYRDIFEALANRTITMMDENGHGDWTPPGAAAAQQPNDPAGAGDFMQWMSSIADTGGPPSSQMQGQNDASQASGEDGLFQLCPSLGEL